MTGQEFVDFAAGIDANASAADLQVLKHDANQSAFRLLSMMDETKQPDFYCLKKKFTVEGKAYE